MTRRICLSWASAFTLLASSAAMAEPPAFVPAKHGGEVSLFDAGSHDWNGVRNYTASWKKGSDMLPTATPVSKDDSNWIEFTFQGRQGMACSTLYFEKLPEPNAGMQYRGIQFVLDCDRDDYPHIGVTVAFSDQSTLSHDLTLEQSPQRIQWLKDFMAQSPPFDELQPRGNDQGQYLLARSGEYYLLYCTDTKSQEVELAGDGPYKVDLVDPWEMTITPLGVAQPGEYTVRPAKSDLAYRFTPVVSGEEYRAK